MDRRRKQEDEGEVFERENVLFGRSECLIQGVPRRGKKERRKGFERKCVDGGVFMRAVRRVFAPPKFFLCPFPDD